MLEYLQKKGDLFLNFVLEFLMSDYSSWGFLNISYSTMAKTGEGAKRGQRKHLLKKRTSER